MRKNLAGHGNGRVQLRFYTKEECEEWLRGRERPNPNAGPETQVERIAYPTEPHRIFGMAYGPSNSGPIAAHTLAPKRYPEMECAS